MSGETIKVFVIDDHALVRDGVRAAIEREEGIELAGEAGEAMQAVERYRELRPDVTLMDLSVRGVSGLEILDEIRKVDTGARVVIFTHSAGDVQAVRAIQAGAVGYLLKSSFGDELISTIRLVHAGDQYVTSEIANAIAFNSRSEMLSEREVSVLRLVAEGHANKQIAPELGVSEDTIKAHLKSIFVKLDAADRTHAVIIALRRGILSL